MKTDRPEIVSVLIVDDDADWVTECAFMLDQLGYEPITALSSEEALEVVRDNDVSLAIVDYNMPGCDGVTLIEQLLECATAQGRQMRFIMATAYATIDVAIAAMRATVADFLPKPVAPAELRQALQRASGLNHSSSARSALLDKLASLSSELQHLSGLIDDKPGSGHDGSSRATDLPMRRSESQKLLVEFIRDELQVEARRRQLGGGTLFGDPTWYMLLDLLLAKLEGRLVSVSSASIASGVPTTTALRLIRRLVNDNVLTRVPDERDGRRDFLSLNEEVEQLLLDYLSEQAQRKD